MYLTTARPLECFQLRPKAKCLAEKRNKGSELFQNACIWTQTIDHLHLHSPSSPHRHGDKNETEDALMYVIIAAKKYITEES
jgi:hypothetical protein